MSEILTEGPRACVTGHPIAHSRSPMIHNYWLKTLNIKGHYDRVDTPPDVFPTFIRSMREKGYVGCNVTLPNTAPILATAAKVSGLSGGRLIAGGVTTALQSS